MPGCACGLSKAFSTVATVLGLVAVGVGGYNYASIGCPFGRTCETGSASAGMVAPDHSHTRGRRMGPECCAGGETKAEGAKAECCAASGGECSAECSAECKAACEASKTEVGKTEAGKTEAPSQEVDPATPAVGG